MKWTNEQNTFLKESIKAKADQGEVSSKLKRTPGAVYVHAYEMGLNPKSIGWTASLKAIKKGMAEVGTRKHVVSIRKMDRKQLEQMSKILSISNGEQFEDAFFKMFPKASTQIMYNVYSHRKKNLKTVQDRLKDLDAKRKDAARAAAGVPVPPVQVITRTKSSPDLETLMVELVNEARVQTRLLEEIAGKTKSAS